MQRTNYCGLINQNYLNQEAIVKGWVHRRRDLGGVVFFDLRDREGLIQVVVEPNSNCFAAANKLKHEYVVEVQGLVRARPNPNLELANGKVEILATKINILNSSEPVPILVDDETVSEANRLAYRIVDLRSQKMQKNLRLRHKLTMAVRNYLDRNGFIDIETPFLTLSTPGGARDFLVPSRMHKGKFYALPQSPQIFKQLLMVGGFDRYYQIVRCFRDEELRADRQPEFTQIDIETSFLNAEEIRSIMEALIVEVFKDLLGVDLPKFPVLTYNEAIYNYGSDKPDFRLEHFKFIDLTEELKASNFSVFKNAANLPNGRVVALKLSAPNNLTRKEIDELTEFVAKYGLKGLAYIKVNDVNQLNSEGLSSSIVKFLNANDLESIVNKTGAQNGDILLFGADKAKVVNEAMGALRLKLGHEKGLAQGAWKFLWVVDFPMFEYDEEKNLYTPAHHAFTAPKDEDLDKLMTNPGECHAKSYDMVLNGSEIGGGSVRIYRSDIQEKVFQAINLSKEEARLRFGYLLDNLQFGAPPHGGLAFGLDRLTAIICGADSIRDVIALPKTTTGQCLLTQAPNMVNEEQLTELGIKVDK